jgi:uncharacterized protein (DUF1800 family)
VTVSERERTAHVLRRLSMAPQPDLAASLPSAPDAIARALDLSAPLPAPAALPPSTDAMPNVRNEVVRLFDAYAWWFGRMASTDRMIEERLTWFWIDHFAISLQKVRSADLVWQFHNAIRTHATGSFADLLHVVAKHGAMLVYLDGLQNAKAQRNENFAREVMELHTMGRDQYTQDDVVAMARACTGWLVKTPRFPQTERVAPPGTPEFGSYLFPRRHDDGTKTLLGATGNFDLDAALDVVLSKPATARFVAGKLYYALVGAPPAPATLDTLAPQFAKDWSVMKLVVAITEHPAFTADLSVRTITRSPVEKLVALLQATRTSDIAMGPALNALKTLAYIPFFAPNPAGYPKGDALLGPQQLVHTFDLFPPGAQAIGGSPAEVLARFGVFDASPETLAALQGTKQPRLRTLLALGSPEVAVR